MRTDEKDGLARKRESRSRVAGSKVWTGGILAALIAAIGIYAVMMYLEKRMLSDYEKTAIYVAKVSIPKGQEITTDNCGEYTELTEIDKTLVPASALSDLSQINHLIALNGIDAGALLTKGMFTDRNQLTAAMREPVIAGCKAEDLYQVVGGVLRAGDCIHIYTVSAEGQAELVWQEVFVQEVFDSAGKAIAPGDLGTPAQRINVYLDAADVEQFYSELAQGTLRIVKVCEL